MTRYELDAEQWRRIEPLIPGKMAITVSAGDDNLSFVNGVLWVLRSAPHWHDLLERYGKLKTAHKRFTRRTQGGYPGKDIQRFERKPA